MNVFHKVTVESLKKNRTRTIVTVIGVILSAAMICAVTTFASSFAHYALQTATYQDGNWHGRVVGREYHTYEDISCTGKVEEAAYMQQLGYAALKDGQNEAKPYLYVLGTDKDTDDILPVHITSGRYPAANNEILLPDHLLSNGGIAYQVGDTITLQLGERMLDGFVLSQKNPVYVSDEDGQEVRSEETIQVRESRTYQVVGFYERFSNMVEDFSAPGYTALTVRDKDPSDQYRYDVYFRMKKPKDTFAFMEKMGFDSDCNSDVLMFSGASRYNTFNAALSGFATIVIALIMFGSVALIYNAFSISVSERTRQFGLLSSIGATKKQLAGMIRFEALVVSAIGIPIGILAGVGGIGVTLLLIGDKFSSMGFPLPLTLHVSVISMIAAVLVALVTVLISAWIPSKRARKVTAVEAIRQNRDIQTKAKEVKTSKLTFALFGLPGMLAQKHYKRSKKKYRATILSLFMSIVLFVSASAFTGYLTETVEAGLSGKGHDLSFFSTAGAFSKIRPADLLEKMKAADGVTAASMQQAVSVLVHMDPAYLTDEIQKGAYLGEQNQQTSAVDFQTLLTFVDDEAYAQLLKENQLDPKKYLNKEAPLAIAVESGVSFNYKTQRIEKVSYLKGAPCEMTAEMETYIEGYYRLKNIHTDDGQSVVRYVKNGEDADGEHLDLPYEESFTQTQLTVGTVLHKLPYYATSSEQLMLLYPMSLADVVYPGLSRVEADHSYGFYMLSSNHKNSYTAVKRLLDEHALSASRLYDQAASEENDRNMVIIIRVFSYGFIVLISLIAVANVFNTISTNIGLRRREFAMLKSVGMTQKDFRKMMNYECLLYGAKALLYGLPVSAGVTYWIWKVTTTAYSAAFHLPCAAIGIAVLSVFAVVFATMLYAMNKIKKESLIETLKNENT